MKQLSVFAFCLFAVMMPFACTSTEPSDSYNYSDYGDDAAYTAGYDDGRATGYDDGYSTGYDEAYAEGRAEIIECAEFNSTDLYYGEDEYQAIPLDSLRNCE